MSSLKRSISVRYQSGNPDIGYLYHYHFALAYLDKGDYAKSRKEIQSALSSYPDFSPAIKLKNRLEKMKR